MPDFENRSPYRVSVRPDFLMAGISITFGMRRGYQEGYDILHFGEGEVTTQRWDHVDEGANIDQPTFRIQEEFAHALYEELGRYFQGQPDLTTARADLLHERLRVDKLVEAYEKLALRSIEAFEEGL
jgi:hypothetical protein